MIPFGHELLTQLEAREFSSERLLRLFTAAPDAFWRHDVDVSLSAAARMARFAHLAGVRSTFYVMPRSEFYNPFSAEGEQAIRSILECGHRVGIHCDYRGGYVHDAVLRDQLLMRHIDGVECGLVSFHMPSPEVLWRDFDGFDNAYASRWEGRYVSDSRGEWDAEKQARVDDTMQVNLHPEHWFPCG